MAEFDPQGPADNEAKDKAPTSSSDPCDDSGSCCGSGYNRWRQDENDYQSDSFVADWSGAEKTLEAQANAFEASHAEPRQPDAFWVELVASQKTAEGTSSSIEVVARTETPVGVQSEQFWADLVASQKTGEGATSSSQPVSSTPMFSSLSHPPTGMGWQDEEASEWSPPEREEQAYEAVSPAGEPVETYASARRDDVEWSQPAEQDFTSARSEGMAFDPSGESSPPTLMSAAIEAAQHPPKAKKTRAAKPAGAKKAAAKKSTKAKKPAKKAAKKPTAKKVVKKATPAPKITKAPPTRRAA